MSASRCRRRRRDNPTISVSPPPQQPSPSPSRRRRDNPTISVSPPPQQAPPSPSRRRRNNPTISVSPPPQQPPPSPSRPRRSLRLKEKMVHVSIFCHDDLQALQDRSDGRMFLKLVSLESLRISTDSYALLRNLIEQRYGQCPQIDLLSFVAGVAVELLEIKHDLSSLLEEAVLGEGFPKALILLKNSAIGLKRLSEEAKERLGEDVFLGNVRVVGAMLKGDADDVLGGTRKFAWFQSRLPPVLNGIDSLLSTQVLFP